MKAIAFFALCIVVSSAQRPDPSAFKCSGNEDCPKFHWCHYKIRGLGRTVGTECRTNLNDSFGPACNGDDAVCKSSDDQIRTDIPNDSTAMCFNHAGVQACRRSYFMPCASNNDCADGFGCQEKPFSDGFATVCYPNKWYEGGGERCKSVQDCGFSSLFGYKWMPCVGVCSQIRM